jgi:PAS domain S-box-containing protein
VRCLPDGTRTFVNEAYCRYAGAPAGELIGKSFFPFIPEEEREAIYQKYASLTAEQPVATEEHRAYALDGSLRWHRWTDRGIFDAAGRLIEIQAVGRDITDERAAQDQLRRSEESYRRLYSAMPVAVWEIDFTEVLRELRRRGFDTAAKIIAAVEQDPAVFFECSRLSRIITANDAALAMAGATTPGDVQRWLRERYTNEAALAYIHGAAQVILGDVRTVDIELPLHAPDGTRIDLLERLSRVPDWSGEPKIVVIALDVSERKRMQRDLDREREALTRADKMISLGVLVSGVAHEVSNPNHAIMLNVSLLRDAWRGIVPIVDEHAARDGPMRVANLPWEELRGEVASMIDDVEHATDRIRGIVTELRTFALDPEPGEGRAVSMNDVVTSSLRLLGNHIRKATNRFSVELAPDLPAVRGNPRRLEQVLVNLVINACHALPNPDCAVTIETGMTETDVFVRVIDEGRGISRDDLRRITEPFFTTKRAAGGTGLGLAVSERIAQEHGGTLTFESEPGKGTTATLSIPYGE